MAGLVQLSTDDLLAAEVTLANVVKAMAVEYEKSQGKWPRNWMQKHVNERATLINARKILIDRAEAAIG